MGAAGVAMGAQGAGSAIGAYGAYQNGVAQQNYYNYLAGNKRTQASMVLQQGDQASGIAQDEGLVQTKQVNRNVQKVEGSQQAEAGANGTAGSVTAADITTDTEQKKLLDQMAIRYNADRASYQAKSDAARQAWALNNEADEDEVAGRNAKKAGKIGAFTSLLSGAGQVAGTTARMRS